MFVCLRSRKKLQTEMVAAAQLNQRKRLTVLSSLDFVACESFSALIQRQKLTCGSSGKNVLH